MAEEKKERTDARRRADLKYKNTHFDRLAVMIPKGTRDVYKQAASDRGLSLRQFVIRSMDEFIVNHPI